MLLCAVPPSLPDVAGWDRPGRRGRLRGSHEVCSRLRLVGPSALRSGSSPTRCDLARRRCVLPLLRGVVFAPAGRTMRAEAARHVRPAAGAALSVVEGGALVLL